MSDKRWAVFNADGRLIAFESTQADAEEMVLMCNALGIGRCAVRHCHVGDTDEAYWRGYQDGIDMALKGETR